MISALTKHSTTTQVPQLFIAIALVTKKATPQNRSKLHSKVIWYCVSTTSYLTSSVARLTLIYLNAITCTVFQYYYAKYCAMCIPHYVWKHSFCPYFVFILTTAKTLIKDGASNYWQFPIIMIVSEFPKRFSEYHWYVFRQFLST